MLSINTNLSSLITLNSMKTSTNKVNQAIERMTTGYKVNHAKDNAAGYSIITDLSTRISSLLQVQQNTEDGIALLSTAEGGLQEIQTQLERLRELTMQASTGTYDATTRAKMQTEADSIIKEINRLRKTVEYDGRSLFYSTEVEPLMERINNILGETNIASPASLQVANSNQTPLALTATISDTVEIQVGEIKDIVIDGVNYSVENNGSVASNFEYSKDLSSGVLTITCNKMTITGQNNVSHKIVLNGNTNKLTTGDYDDIIETASGGNFTIYSGAGNDRITMRVATGVIDDSGDDTYCIENAQSAVYTIRDIAGNNNININNTPGVQLEYNSASGSQNTFYINGYRNTIRSTDGDNLFVTLGNNSIVTQGSGRNYVAGTVSGTGFTQIAAPLTNGINTIDNHRFEITANTQTTPIKPGALIFTNPFTNSLEIFAYDATVRDTSYGHRGKNYVINGQNSEITVPGGMNNTFTIGAGSFNNVIKNYGNIHQTTWNINCDNNVFELYNDAYVDFNVTGSGNTFNAALGIRANITGDNNTFNAYFFSDKFDVYGNNNRFTSTNGYHLENCNIYGNNNTILDMSSSIYGDINISVMGSNNGIQASGTSSLKYTVSGSNNILSGADGVDIFTVTGSNNTLNGGAEDDAFVINSGTGNIIDGGSAVSTDIMINKGRDTNFSNVTDCTLNGFSLNVKVGIGSTESSILHEEISFDTFGFSVDLSSQESARASLVNIDELVQTLSDQLLSIGTSINRLEMILEEQSIKLESMMSSRSTVRDADIAEVSSQYIQQQILQQASATLMATANQSPAIALQLI